MSSPDKLTIETPEQTPLEFAVAGIGSRFLALAADSLIQVVTILIFLVLSRLIAPNVDFISGHTQVWIQAVFVILLFLIQFAYFAVFEAVWNGQTPGKRLTHLRVIRDDGRPIRVSEAVVRNLLRTVDALPGIYAVGIACAFFSRQSKRLGDWVAGTVVVREAPLQGIVPPSDAMPADASKTGDARKISNEELRLIEAFLDRRAALDPIVRRNMAHQIAVRMGRQLEVPPENRPDAEKFLEALAEAKRSVSRYS
jgi:uncharacterized RDD family membrane protein YckC